MYQYRIGSNLTPLSGKPEPDTCVLTLLSSEELEQNLQLPGLEQFLRHTPTARDARVCRAEPHRNYLCGTIVTPRHTKEKEPIAFGYLMTPSHVVLCDDAGVAHAMIQRLIRENPQMEKSPGSFFYTFLELIIVKDMHHLQELEDKLDQLEDQVLAGQLEGFNPQMTVIRKEISNWIRYYTQLDDTLIFLCPKPANRMSRANYHHADPQDKRKCVVNLLSHQDAGCTRQNEYEGKSPTDRCICGGSVGNVERSGNGSASNDGLNVFFAFHIAPLFTNIVSYLG